MNLFCVCLMLVAVGDGKSTAFDFEDAAVGKLPAGWTSAKGGKGEGSVWKVLDDATAPKGSKVLAQTSADGPGSLFNLCIADKPSLADLDLSLSFKAIAGKKDQGGGPVWRYKDPSNYYVVRMNPLEDNFRLYKIVDGKRIQLASVDLEAATGQWHLIRVVHQGDRIQCYLNGKKHFDVKDDAIQAAGKTGLWTKADAQTSFDQIVIRAPKE